MEPVSRALGYGPLGPRLRRNGFATEIKSRPICGASGFPLSPLRPARATAPQEWVRHRDQIAPHLRGLWFPALGYGPLGPRLRTGLVDGDRIASYCEASGFPLLATARSGHGTANGLRRQIPDPILRSL